MGRFSYKMAGIPECGAVRGRDKMVGKKAVFLFVGRNHRIFSGALVAGFRNRYYFLCPCVFDGDGPYCTNTDLGGSGVRLAFSGVHYLFCEWNPAFLYRNCGTVPVKDIPGDETSANFYSKGFQ